VCSVMAVVLVCELPVPVLSDDDHVTGWPTVVAVSVVTSQCERPRNILLPVDLRQRRRQTRYPTDFAVCVPPLFGNISTTDLVEFIEVRQYSPLSGNPAFTVSVDFAAFRSTANTPFRFRFFAASLISSEFLAL